MANFEHFRVEVHLNDGSDQPYVFVVSNSASVVDL